MKTDFKKLAQEGRSFIAGAVVSAAISAATFIPVDKLIIVWGAFALGLIAGTLAYTMIDIEEDIGDGDNNA
ncbi:hypothetical protein ACO0K2_18375 [Undibacterium sp. MH2W]|uniref:hypothetical protein n=1 Tax=Undibacterium sp. MH2W TaxID=3413044 RepID=UPI003BF27DA2